MLKTLAVSMATLATLAVPAMAAGKITAAQARKVVMAKYPGATQVGKTTYENEEKGWEYGVTVRYKGVLHEVMVDAKTGKIASEETTTAAEEAKEARVDAAAAKHAGH